MIAARMHITMALALLVLGAGCRTVLLDAPVRPREGDWTTTGGSFARNTWSPVTIRPPLVIAWDYNAGGAFGPGSGVVVDDVLLVGTRKGELHAVELESGTRIGIVNLKEPIEGTPVLDPPRLYLGTAWGDESLRAYDLEEGSTVWEVEAGRIDAALTLAADRLIVATTDGAVSAHDPDDGTAIWTVPAVDGMITASPVSDDEDRVIVADQQGLVRALRTADGAEIWRTPVDAPVYAPLTIVGDQVVVPTTRGRIVALDPASGRQRWQYVVIDRTVRFGPAAGDNRLVVFGATDGSVRAVDPRDGSLTWMAALDDGIVAQPLVTGDVVWVATLGRALVALSAADGTELWQMELPGRSRSAITVHDGGLVVLSEPRTVLYLVPGEDVE